MNYSADLVFQALVLISWPVSVMFVLIYGLTAAWWKSNLGRGLFIKAVGVAIILSYSGLFYLFGSHYWGRDEIRVIGMGLVFAGLTYNTVNLIHAQVRARRSRTT